MSSVVLSGDTSGAITISAPSVAGTNTLTLPANTGTVITTGSSGQVIPKAALPTGSVLQVVQTSYSTVTSTSSTSPVSTGFTSSITPQFSTSKILLIMNMNCGTTTNGNGVTLQLWRGGASIFQANLNHGYLNIGTTMSENHLMNTQTYLDSPATTSTVTYTHYFNSSNSGTVYFCVNSNTSTVTLMEIAA